MSKSATIQQIIASKMIVIIRLGEQKLVPQIIRKVIAAGVKVLEITTNTPGFTEELANAREQYPEIIIGAGSVYTAELAELAIMHGAQFLVTPNTNVEVIQVAHSQQIPVLMGAFTPTEVAIAIRYEADFIKLFPASIFGPDYLKALRGPFDQARFIAVGGINETNVLQWMEAGAIGVGVGGSLINGSPESLSSRIQTLIEKLKSHVG